MSDKIKDYTGALPPPEPDKESEIDPTKFKKVLKIDESEESQKKDKRRLKKKEEEGEDEEQGVDAPSLSTTFSDFMQQKDEVKGLFDVQSSIGQVRESSTDKPIPFKTTSTRESPPIDHENIQGHPAKMIGNLGEATPSQTSKFGVEEPHPLPPPPIVEANGYTQQQPPPEEFLPQYPQRSPGKLSQEESPPQYSQQFPKTPPPPLSYNQVTNQDQKEAPEKKKKAVDTSLLAGKTKRIARKKSKEEKAPIYIRKKQNAELAPSEKKSTSKEKLKVVAKKRVNRTPKQSAALGKQKKTSQKNPGDTVTNPTSKKLKVVAKKGVHLTSEQAAALGEQKKTSQKNPGDTVTNPTSKKLKVVAKKGVHLTSEQAAALGEQETFSKKNPDDTVNNPTATFAIEGAITTPEGIVTNTQSTESPAYTKLNPQVFELFERMIGVLTIQQHTNVTTTTITISMKNSVFNGSKITLDQYSTAPNSFNIRLQGTPEAIQLFNANLGELMAAFQQTKSPYTVNILNPSLLKKYRTVKRRGKRNNSDPDQEQQK